MLFSSITFLYFFLPAVILLYYLVPKAFKNTVLLCASLLFYGWGEPRYLVIMAAAILQGYVFGLLIARFQKHQKRTAAKLCLSATSILSLGILGYFKYADFFIENWNAVTGMSIPLLRIALPIGVSFYTFQILSYSIDIYRGQAAAQKNPINFAAYIALFPQLIAGPIVRYSDIAEQLGTRKHSVAKASEGTRRFILGLSKKVLIANLLGELVNSYKEASDHSVLFVWLYMIAYSLHIYFDFSGYSDMAIGLGKIFGFQFCENFNYPYISSSATEFWRRWHMSLGTWFRDYVYIPLGGNRVPKWRWFLNIFIVWMTTGFWHGASWNFMIWGLFFGVLLCLEKLVLLRYLERWKWLGHIYTAIAVIISFVIFDSANMTAAFHVIRDMFGFGGLPLINTESLYLLRSYAGLLCFSAVAATPLLKHLAVKLTKHPVGNPVLRIAEAPVLAVLLVTVTAFLVDGSFNPFLYFRF